MRAFTRLTALVAAALCARGVVLTSSGVYTLTIGSQALVHASASAPTITAPQSIPGAANQAWTVVVNKTASTATFQNIATRNFMAISVNTSGVPSIVPAASPLAWTIVPSNGNNKLCQGSFCLVLNGGDALIISPINKGSQDFAAVPTTPPNGAYQIQNVATGRIIAGEFIPHAAVFANFPATDRSQVWQVTQTDGDAVSMFNFDFAGVLSVQPQGIAVGTFDSGTRVPWTIVYVDGVGQILQSSTGASMTATGNGVSISGARDTTAAWVFFPEDGSKFLP
ncbi:hypothetical protein AURDEDRAFT_112946 [Auricularia subglabra TFB-10046 SS5]|nr:hypothetical protein AURDEDRAFT_112946 [Auricularia subglabra TFB-10046 SS5]